MIEQIEKLKAQNLRCKKAKKFLTLRVDKLQMVLSDEKNEKLKLNQEIDVLKFEAKLHEQDCIAYIKRINELNQLLKENGIIIDS